MDLEIWIWVADCPLKQRANLRKHPRTILPPIQSRWHESLCLTHVALVVVAHHSSKSPSAKTTESARLSLFAIYWPRVSRQRRTKNVFKPRWQVRTANARVILAVEVL